MSRYTSNSSVPVLIRLCNFSNSTCVYYLVYEILTEIKFITKLNLIIIYIYTDYR
jgi:hypothetical protein